MLAGAANPDRIIGGLTARQLAILGVAAVAVGGLFSASANRIPTAASAAICIPLAIVGIAAALGKLDGIGLDKMSLFALRFFRRPRRRVLVAGDIPSPPAWSERKSLAPLDFPVKDVLSEGIVDVGDEGFALVCRASPVNLALKAEKEQEASMLGFGRYLNAVSRPIEILVRSGRADLSARIEALEQHIPALPHPRLAEEALGYLDFLTRLGARGDALRREAFLCLREKTNSVEQAEAGLRTRFDEASGLLRSTGVNLTILSNREARAFLARMTDRHPFESTETDGAPRSENSWR